MRKLLSGILLDAASTLLGIMLGLPEKGPLASLLIQTVGPLYFGIEFSILYLLCRVVGLSLDTRYAELVIASVPWLAGWHNMGVVTAWMLKLHGF